jgi:hypothetical protein
MKMSHVTRRELVQARCLAISVFFGRMEFADAEFDLAQFTEVSRELAGRQLQNEILRFRKMRHAMHEKMGVQAE